jgi:hypothetical protein
MGVHVVWNTIRDVRRKHLLERAVLDAIGDRPSAGHWDVKLTECDALPGWTAVVVAPDRTRVAWYFEGDGEDDDPELVRLRIEILLQIVNR